MGECSIPAIKLISKRLQVCVYVFMCEVFRALINFLIGLSNSVTRLSGMSEGGGGVGWGGGGSLNVNDGTVLCLVLSF